MRFVLFSLLFFCFSGVSAHAQDFPETLHLVATHESHSANDCVVFGRVALFPSGSVASGRPLVFDPAVGLYLEGNLFSIRMPVMAVGATVSDREGYVVDRTGQVWKTNDGGVNWKKTGTAGGEPLGAASTGPDLCVWLKDGRAVASSDMGKTFKAMEVDGRVRSVVASGDRVLVLTEGGKIYRAESVLRKFDEVTTFEGKAFERVFATPSGFYGIAGNRVYRSSDAGAWEPAFTADVYQNETLTGMAWDSKDVGVVVSNRGAVFFTYDGGRTWTKVRYRIGDRWKSAAWVSGRLLVLGTERLYTFSKRGGGV